MKSMEQLSVEAAASQYLLDETVRDGPRRGSGSNAHAAGPHLPSALTLCVCVCLCECNVI